MSAASVTRRTSQAPSTPPRSLNLRKQELVRDAIWNAAIDLFVHKGFDETTVDDIATAAGTSRRTFFRYFESKSDLLVQPIVVFGESLSEAIAECPASCSGSEILQDTVLRVARSAAAHPRTRQVMQITAKYPAARQAQVGRMAEVEEQISAAFARRLHEKRASLQSHVMAALTLSMMSVVFRCWFETREKDIAKTADQVFAALADAACSPRMRTPK